MTEKIITTFETTLTWYKLIDNLPTDRSSVLLALNEFNIVQAIFLICEFDWIFESPDNGAIEYYRDDIKYWAYLPEFE